MIFSRSFILTFLAIISAAWCVKSPREFHSYSFEDYMTEFGKSYDDSEISFRRSIFEKNMDIIRKHNSMNSTWFMGATPFIDMTDSEHKKFRGYHKKTGYMRRSLSPILLTRSEINPNHLPKSVDWRKKGVVTPVKDQGSCGSCWAFTAAETLESHLAISSGTLKELSEEELVSCTPNVEECGGSGGCDGATVELAFDYVIQNGLTDEETFPYSSYYGDSGECPTNSSLKKVVSISGYTQLPSNQYLPLMHAVATKGPIAISVDASTWSTYKGGIFNGCDNENPEINHAVQLVGYGEEDGIPYWLIRNSWSSDWGEDGYIRIRRYTSDTPCGMDKVPSEGSGCKGETDAVKVCGNCGILFDNSYPTGVQLV